MGKINAKEENRIIIRNSMWSIGFKGAEYLLTFLTTPLLLRCLGISKYGVYTSALSLVSWIYYFDFGIGSGLRNKITESIVKEDYDMEYSLYLVKQVGIYAEGGTDRLIESLRKLHSN